MISEILYDRGEDPFGFTWEKWTEVWYKWMMAIPKERNPCLDETGEWSSMNQNNENVWFLAGTFGNTNCVRRECTVPKSKALLFPLLVKEDSLADDSDLMTEPELVRRCKNATDKVTYMEAKIDDKQIRNLEKFRVRSQVFDLMIPENNVYDIMACATRSVCDGFWIFVRPMTKGPHSVYFKGETKLDEPYTRNFMMENEAYANVSEHLVTKGTFILEVSYYLTIL
jgi:hypothetical protein